MKLPLTLSLLVGIALPTSVSAQEFGIPASVLTNPTFQRHSESQIVIRVRSTSDRQNLCGSNYDLSRSGITTDGFDFPRPGVQSRYDFPRPGQSLQSFQLPQGAKNPDIIGCIDSQRNLLFINIFKSIESSVPTPEPTEPIIPKTFSPNYPGIKR
jgi:hypothetical protein